MIFFLIFLLGIAGAAFADGPNLCDIIDLDSCSGVTRQGRRSSMLSLPSPTASAAVNPATVSFDRGMGLEVIHQSGNPAVWGLASGTGKVGGALINTSLENTFFGNRVFELSDELLRRHEEKKQYDTKKMSLSLGARLTRKKHLSLDAGVILKRHSEIGRINPGIGVSGRIGPLNFGASYYQDDLFIDLEGQTDPLSGIPYTVLFGTSSIEEKFKVTTYSVGTAIKSFSFDAGFITTKFEELDDDVKVQLYSAAFIYRNLRFSLALRNERSSALKYVDGELVDQESKSGTFGAVHASLGKHVILGVNYNYFLLEELSIQATLFF